jgi:hypothetical protein
VPANSLSFSPASIELGDDHSFWAFQTTEGTNISVDLPKFRDSAQSVPARRLVRLPGASPDASSAVGAGDAFAPQTSAAQNPQGPLSLDDAHLEYLKLLNASEAIYRQVSRFFVR